MYFKLTNQNNSNHYRINDNNIPDKSKISSETNRAVVNALKKAIVPALVNPSSRKFKYCKVVYTI